MCHVSYVALMCHVSCVACHLSPVTRRMSLTPTDTATDPPPAFSPLYTEGWFAKTQKICIFWQGNFRPTLSQEWVNPSKRGGMDGVFRGMAGLLQGISRG